MKRPPGPGDRGRRSLAVTAFILSVSAARLSRFPGVLFAISSQCSQFAAYAPGSIFRVFARRLPSRLNLRGFSRMCFIVNTQKKPHLSV